MSWKNICKTNDILPFGGRCALIDNEQVAIFRVPNENGEQFFAIANYDPFSKANVISRGLVGSIDGKLVVASPIYKQHFDLLSGKCLEDDSVQLKTWQVQVEDDVILVAETETETETAAA